MCGNANKQMGDIAITTRADVGKLREKRTKRKGARWLEKVHTAHRIRGKTSKKQRTRVKLRLPKGPLLIAFDIT